MNEENIEKINANEINMIELRDREKELKKHEEELAEQKQYMRQLLAEYIAPITKEIVKDELKMAGEPLLEASASYTDKRVKKVDDKAESMKIVAYEGRCGVCKRTHIFDHIIKLKCPTCKTPFDDIIVRQKCDMCDRQVK